MITYGHQVIAEDDIEAVVKVLRSDYLTQGPSIQNFEKTVAEFCGAKYAVATCNATAALHISCLALGLKENDLLWTSPITFVASANCALYCGAKVDFVDIDPKTLNMSAMELEKKLVKAKKEGRLPKVVVPVHFGGQSCEMDKIKTLSERFGFSILEDASHAIGGQYRNRAVGNCEFSDATVFSFHPVKIITTAEGGMVTTNNRDLYDKLAMLRSHGITRDASKMTKPSEGPWYYQQLDLGLNYRMTDMQAALGISQMPKLGAFIKRRQELVARYDSELQGFPLTVPGRDPNSTSAHHLYCVRLALKEMKKTKKEIFVNFLEKGIGVNLHYIPVHLQPYFTKFGFKPGDFPHAEKYYEEAMTLPLHPGISDEQQSYIISTLKDVLQ